MAAECHAVDDSEKEQTLVHGGHIATGPAGITRTGALDACTMSAAPDPNTRCGSPSRSRLVTVTSPVG